MASSLGNLDGPVIFIYDGSWFRETRGGPASPDKKLRL
jgi:hypothetical protein